MSAASLPSLSSLSTLALAAREIEHPLMSQSLIEESESTRFEKTESIGVKRARGANRPSQPPDMLPSEYGIGDRQSGITVIKVMDSEELLQIRQELIADINKFPEFARDDERRSYLEYAEKLFRGTKWEGKDLNDGESTFENQDFLAVQGGYQFLGNPSSFHCNTVRKLRRLAQIAVLTPDERGSTPFELLLRDPSKNLEQDADRLTMRRLIKPTATGETWHRDEAGLALPGDVVCGGWINLDLDKDQFFSAVPYSANEVGTENKGFAKIDESQYAYCEENNKRVLVPPGHMLIFDERTIHEVLPNKTTSRDTMLRLFTGWRVTSSIHPLVPDLRDRLDILEALPIKSAQHAHPTQPPYWKSTAFGQRGIKYPGPPPMFADLHWCNNPQLIAQLSAHYSPKVHICKTYGSGSKNAQALPNGINIVPQFMRGLIGTVLKDFNDNMPKYSEEDIALLYPRRVWTITVYENSKTYRVPRSEEQEEPAEGSCARPICLD